MPLAGPYLWNGQITMNGLAEMVESVKADVGKVAKALAASQSQVAALQTELDQVKATLARIEQAVVPAGRKTQTASFR